MFSIVIDPVGARCIFWALGFIKTYIHDQEDLILSVILLVTLLVIHIEEWHSRMSLVAHLLF